MLNKSGRYWSMCLALIFCLMLPLACLAGDGGGDGSGGGQQQPLVVESVMPADGAVGVDLNPQIKITFNKNVCYMTVRENNRNCFSMWTGSTRVPIEVIMADDQVEREKRNDAIIKPLNKLQAGTLYRIEIAPGMESKSGVTLGKKTTLSFTTAGSLTGSAAETVAPPEKQAIAAAPDKTAPAAPETAVEPASNPDGQQPQTAAAVDQNTGTQQQETSGDVAAQQDYRYKRIFIDLTVVVAAGLGAWWMYRKRRGL